PFLIPNTLPYTLPATTLFATCVVYGRLTHDNEITAIRSAGAKLNGLIVPCLLLGGLASAGTAALYYEYIPSIHQMLRSQVFSDVEDVLYGMIKRSGCLRHRSLPFSMWVREVQGKHLIDVIVKERHEKGGHGA